ncbi:MAG TPA: response regulator transcription factor [Gammaproteobacteria bacterium]|nr:response regulator transcription factor [Gammaproteobacteria bacterium]
MTRRVLVVEDSRDIADLLALHLRDLDCEATLVADGVEGLAAAEEGGFDLMILDLMLPGMDGLELCRRMRAAGIETPVLMLTAKSSEVDRVVGLEMGADDYVTKPFSIPELLARVKAIFRRSTREQSGEEPERIRAGGLEIDVAKHKVTLNGETVALTAKEFDLLVHFARHPGRVYTRSELLDRVWGYAHEGYEHTVNSHINRLRAKIEPESGESRYILTVWGVGYKFNDELGP